MVENHAEGAFIVLWIAEFPLYVCVFNRLFGFMVGQ